jgi:hypothetical protein
VQLGRRVHIGELVFFKEPHGHAEIVLAEEQQVDTGDGRDFVDVLDAVGRFHLQRDDDVVVGGARIAEQSGLVHAALREIDRACSSRGIARAAHRLAGLFGGINVGNQNAVGAHVERLLDAAAIMIASHAHQRFRAAAGDPGQHARQF